MRKILKLADVFGPLKQQRKRPSREAFWAGVGFRIAMNRYYAARTTRAALRACDDRLKRFR